MKLLLFDLDGTLLRTHGAGIRAMQRSGRELFGPGFETGVVSGGMDPLIYEEAARRSGVSDPARHHGRFQQLYMRMLREELAVQPERVQALPGVVALLERLGEHAGVTLGLATGNYRATAPLKMRAAGLELTPFMVQAYGDEAADRAAMIALALERAVAHAGPLRPSDAIVIGDTPRDVACAHANGCSCIAVATGRYDEQQLARAGADVVLGDLSDARVVFDLLA